MHPVILMLPFPFGILNHRERGKEGGGVPNDFIRRWMPTTT
jgi:hypothetical protein